MPPGPPGGIALSLACHLGRVNAPPHPPLAVAVLMADRGALPYADLHGRPLYAHAAAAAARIGPVTLLVDAGSAPVDPTLLPPGTAVSAAADWWAGLGERAALLHDALCPLTPAEVLRGVVDRHRADPGLSLAGFRPVTDTVKTMAEGRIVGTVDRDRLAVVASPVLVAAELVAAERVAAELVVGAALPPWDDLSRLIGWVRARGRLALVEVPSLARRVEDEAAVHVLECVDELAHRVRPEGPASVDSG